MKFELRPGHEIRGFMIRLYPDAEQIETMVNLIDAQRYVWNWLIGERDNAWRANRAHAIKLGLVPSPPQRPDYTGLEPTEAKALRASNKAEYWAWCAQLRAATKDLPGPRKFKELLEHYGCKHDYQLFQRVLCWSNDELARPGAHMLQALAKNFWQKADRPKRKRKRTDTMPLQVRSGKCFELGAFGDRRGKSFYDCQVSINGLKIRGRLPGKVPNGRVLEGVSVHQEPDGWWASIKVEQPIRELPPVVAGSVVGLDAGLDFIVAFDDGRRVANTRGKELSERIAGRQAMDLPTGRLHQRVAKQTKHLIYNEIVKPLANVETIKVERLPAHIGQMGSRKLSAMRTTVDLLKQRYGDRVREVDPSYTSQDCSQCGYRSKESWSYDHGRMGECPTCGFRCDRDVNAARNIAAKPAILQAG